MVAVDPASAGTPESAARSAQRSARVDGALEAIAHTLAGSIVLMDKVGVITLMSDDVCELLGIHEREVVGRNGFELLHPSDLDAAVDMFQGAIDGSPDVHRLTLRLRTSVADEESADAWRWVEIFARNALDSEVASIVLSVRDVHRIVESELDKLRLIEVMEATTDLVIMLDRSFRVTWANPAAEQFLPVMSPGIHIQIEDRVPRWVTRIFADEILPTLRAEGQWTGEVSVLDRKDRARPVDATWVLHRGAHGRTDFMSIIARDITSRLELERQLDVQARTDKLTGVGNRQAALDGIERATRSGAVGVAVIDIEGFKAINDAHGHAVGDRVLAEVGRRLRSQVWSSQMVARLGGDEFAVIWADAGTYEDTLVQSRRLLDDVLGMVTVNEVTLSLHLRAGVSFGERGTSPTELLREATQALGRAKELGELDVVGFDDRLRALSQQRAMVAREIPGAIDRGEFEAWFQPLIDAQTGALTSFEALVRWNHPTEGLVFPDVFIPVAEDTGAIVPLGAAVIERACMHAAGWRGVDGLDGVRVAVNVSARQLADPSLVAVLERALTTSGLAASSMTVEITESLLMADFDAAALLLDDLRMVGVQVAIDDFGTGYSSLAYLQHLPIDVLKIDRRFVSTLSERRLSDYSLVAGIVSIGKSLGLSVVAEGVETEQQASMLRELGVDTLQGYLYSRPMPPDQVVAWYAGAAAGHARS